MSDAPGRTSVLVLATAAACVLLALVEFGLTPAPLRYAWAANLWQYLPRVVAVVLFALLLALCRRSIRTGLLRRLPPGRERSAFPASAAGGLLFVLVAALVLWLLRERRMYGDSDILLYNAASGELGLPLAPERPLAQVIALVDSIGDLGLVKSR